MLRTDRLASFRGLIQFTKVHPYLLKYNSYFRFSTQLDRLGLFNYYYHLYGKPVGPRFGRMVLYAKFRTRVNFVPESIAFTICENQFHLAENDREVSNMGLKKGNTDFRLEQSVLKNRPAFSDVPLLPEIFCWNDLKSNVHLNTFQPDFPVNRFFKW